MEDCIFCKIARGEIPAEKVYEDAEVVAFLDRRPVNPGHLLVIPKIHAANLYEASDASLAATMRVVKRTAVAIKKALGAGGINIHINNDRPAGQVVFHMHVHVIPRYDKDGYEHWHGKDENYRDASVVAQKIRENLE